MPAPCEWGTRVPGCPGPSIEPCGGSETPYEQLLTIDEVELLHAELTSRLKDVEAAREAAEVALREQKSG
jgi:hypothetical protein